MEYQTILLIGIGILLLMGSAVRGVKRALLTLALSIPLGIFFGWLFVIPMCANSQEMYCELQVFFTMPIALGISYIVLLALPLFWFKRAMGFVIGATIGFLLQDMLMDYLRLYELSIVVMFVSIIMGGVFGVYVSTSKREKSKTEHYVIL